MELTYVYIPLSRLQKSRRGLSEKLLKRRLEKNGWQVWRGGFIHASRKTELYPNVERAYKNLAALLEKHKPGALELLQYLSVVHHGMPDYICFRNKEFKFVECKLAHEQLQESQKKCIPKLLQLGFSVEVHTLVDPCTKARGAVVDLETGEKIIHDTQLTIARSLRQAAAARTRGKKLAQTHQK
jgi:hypothetical protein